MNYSDHQGIDMIAPHSLLVIDAAVKESETLIRNLRPNTDVVILDPSQNGIEQITAHLQSHQHLSSLQIVSHGDVGMVQLGNTTIDAQALTTYGDQLSQWGDALIGTGDILFLGCNVGATTAGDVFLQTANALTGLDVAASDDITGTASNNGDWDLERSVGTIDIDVVILEDAQNNYDHPLQFVSHLTLDETSGTLAADSSPDGQANPGTLQNGANFESIGADLNGGVRLDGANDYISLADTLDINLGNHHQKSLAFWFKTDGLVSDKKQVIYEEGGFGRGLNIYLDGDRLYTGGWNIPESGWTGSFLSTTIRPDTWHHVVLTLDAAQGDTTVQPDVLTAYLDGAEFGTGSGSELGGHSTIAIGAIRGATRFHDETLGGNGNQAFDGVIGDARLYDRVLTPAEVLEQSSINLPGSPQEFVMHLTLDETSGNTAADSSPDGQSNDSTLRNGASFVDLSTQLGADLGNGVLFDGVNDYIDVPNSPDITTGQHPQRSIAILFRADDLDDERQVLYEEGGNSRGLNIYLDNGRLYVGGWNIPQSSWNGTFLSTGAVREGEWHQVVLTLDATGDPSVQSNIFRAYLDGVRFGQGDGSQLWGRAGIGIGAQNGAARFHDSTISGTGVNAFNGAIADVRVYNDVLSTTDVQTLFDTVQTLDLPPTAIASPSDIFIGGSTTYEFEVTFRDNEGIDVSTIDNNDIQVTGPGFSQRATRVTVDASTDGSPRRATYRINAPGGEWDSADAGVYTLEWLAGAIADTSNNLNVATTLATFNVIADSPGVIGLGTSNISVFENVSTQEVLIPLIRTGGSAGAAEVSYQTVEIENSATDQVDFIGQRQGIVRFADGQTTANIVIPILDDEEPEPGTESFEVSLSGTEGAELGQPRTAIVNIQDDEPAPDPTLIGYWALNESTIGQAVVDSSAIPTGIEGTHDNEGIHFNLVAPSGGPTTDVPNIVLPLKPEFTNSRGLNFDGVDDYVRIPTDASLDLTEDIFTQSVWLKPTATGTELQGIMGYESPTGPNNEIYPSLWIENDTQIRAGFGTLPKWSTFTTDSVLTLDEWNHVAVTFDRTTYKAYVNGEEVYSTNNLAISAANREEVPDLRRLDLGRVRNDYFQGQLDEVRLYNRALSFGEIQADLIGKTDLPPIPEKPKFIAEEIATGFTNPVSVNFLPSGATLVSSQAGTINLVRPNGTVAPDFLLDIRDRVNRTRGMLGLNLHPDLANNPYLYVTYAYDPPEVFGNTGPGGPDNIGARVGRVSRFTITNPLSTNPTVDPNSEFILIGNNSTYANAGAPELPPDRDQALDDRNACEDENGGFITDCVPVDEVAHNISDLEFGPDGMLYVSTGDGGSFGVADPVNLRVLELDSLAGKVLRIDPMTGNGLSDNPFYDGDPTSNQSKVHSLGLRNPFRIAINPNGGDIYIGDVGWGKWEEINTGVGANFGWPYYQGGNGGNERNPGYSNLPGAQEFYANETVTSATYARSHADGARAIVMGDFNAGTQYPTEFQNKLFFTDFGDGQLRVADLDSNGNIGNVDIVSDSLGVFVDIAQGPDGYFYYVDHTSGSMGRFLYQELGLGGVPTPGPVPSPEERPIFLT